jgi:hypothetical protein
MTRLESPCRLSSCSGFQHSRTQSLVGQVRKAGQILYRSRARCWFPAGEIPVLNSLQSPLSEGGQRLQHHRSHFHVGWGGGRIGMSQRGVYVEIRQ